MDKIILDKHSLEEREIKFIALRTALIEGEKSNIANDYSVENIINQLNKENIP